MQMLSSKRLQLTLGNPGPRAIKCASGNLSLLISEDVSWESFPEQAARLVSKRKLVKLSAYQIRALKRSLAQREVGPSVARSLAASWRTYLIQVCLLGGLSAFWWRGGWRLGSMLVCGVLVGCIFRDLVWFRLTVRNWPLSKEVTDWRRMEELLAENRNET